MKEMMYSLRDSLCNELENFAERGTINMGDLEVIHKLTDTIKNIYKIECLEESGNSFYGGRYSGHDRYYSYDNGMGGGNSYRYNGNSRSRGMRGGNSYTRGRYSYSGDGMAEKIQDMIERENLSQEDQNVLTRALDVLMR